MKIPKLPPGTPPSFEPHEGQLEVIQAFDDYRFRILNCGRRFGKTVLSVNEMLSYAYFRGGSLIVYYAPTIGQARDIAWRMIKGYAYHYGGASKVNEARLELQLKGENGATSEIWLRGTEAYESARGLGINFLVIDELAMMRNWYSIWEEVLRSTLADTKGEVLMLSTPKGYNHWYDLWRMGQVGTDDHVKGYKSWSFPSWSNPYLDKEEVESAKRELTEDSFSQEWGANFKRFTGLVYKSFDRDKHVLDEVDTDKFVHWIMGHDPGFHAPRAMPLLGVDSDGVWYQVDELYMSGLTNPVFREECLRVLDKYQLKFENLALATMDSAHKSDIVELADLGLDFVPVKKSSGEMNKSWVRYKIDKFDERIRSGKFFIHKRCQKTLWEFENYSYPKNRDDQNPDESPMKLNDHMMDALGDLNSMYIHMFTVENLPPWHGKIKGTYIPPSPDRTKQDGMMSWDEDYKDSDELDYWEVIV